MAKKRIVIKPVDTLEFVLPGGETHEAVINTEALIYFQDMYGSLDEGFKEDAVKDAVGFSVKLLHCGMKVCDPSAGFETAEAIVKAGGLTVVNMIIDEILLNFDDADAAGVKKKALEMLAGKKVKGRK